jgi:hypothetical protein
MPPSGTNTSSGVAGIPVSGILFCGVLLFAIGVSFLSAL